jgi:hypothetical protein
MLHVVPDCVLYLERELRLLHPASLAKARTVRRGDRLPLFTHLPRGYLLGNLQV